jgi:hypothetical protein
MPFAAFAQRTVRNAERRADLSYGQKRLGYEQILEPGNEVSMAAAGRRFFFRLFGQTLYQRMEQLLFQPVRSLRVSERSGARFGHSDGRPVEVAQLPRRRTRWSPARHRRNHEPGSTQHAAVIGKLLFQDLNSSPVTGSGSSCVQPLAGTECDHFAGSNFDSAPDRRWSSVDRKRDQDNARRHHDKRNPCLRLLESRQPQVHEPELGQSRPELAAVGDQHPGDAVRAQGSLKILRFTKDRRAAARHSFSPT